MPCCVNRAPNSFRIFGPSARSSGPRIFRDGKPIRYFYGAWRTACKAGLCPGRLLHDFRRTAVRNLERAGVSRSAAMAMVGHKTESIYRRYAIVESKVLHEAAAKIDNFSAAVAAGTKQGQSAPKASGHEAARATK
jgi:integrase